MYSPYGTMAELVVVWATMYVVEVKMEVVWVDGVFKGTFALLTEQCSVVKPMLPLCHHSEED